MRNETNMSRENNIKKFSKLATPHRRLSTTWRGELSTVSRGWPCSTSGALIPKRPLSPRPQLHPKPGSHQPSTPKTLRPTKARLRLISPGIAANIFREIIAKSKYKAFSHRRYINYNDQESRLYKVFVR